MAKEIEMKFRVKECPSLIGIKPIRIEQHYVCLGDKEEARIRKKGDKYFITVKGDGTLERDEWETEISKDSYETLIPAARGRTVIKDRYEVELPGGKIAELDIYRGNLEGSDHITIEVEFANTEEAKAFRKPDWFGEDITADKRFKNKNLATKGWPA